MHNHNSSIRLFQLIKDNTDEQTAMEAASVLQHSVREEVSTESTILFKDIRKELTEMFNELNGKINDVRSELINKINDIQLDLVDRNNSAKLQTILWIVGMSIIQILARYFFK